LKLVGNMLPTCPYTLKHVGNMLEAC